MRFHTTGSQPVKVVSHGPGFLTLLALLFIGLRLAGVVSWHWAWVLAPLWMPAALGMAVLLMAAFAYILVAIFSRRGKK